MNTGLQEQEEQHNWNRTNIIQDKGGANKQSFQAQTVIQGDKCWPCSHLAMLNRCLFHAISKYHNYNCNTEIFINKLYAYLLKNVIALYVFLKCPDASERKFTKVLLFYQCLNFRVPSLSKLGLLSSKTPIPVHLFTSTFVYTA